MGKSAFDRFVDDSQDAHETPRTEHSGARKQITAYLDVEDIKRLKVRAVTEGVRQNAIVERAIKAYLGDRD